MFAEESFAALLVSFLGLKYVKRTDENLAICVVSNCSSASSLRRILREFAGEFCLKSVGQVAPHHCQLADWRLVNVCEV